MSALTVARRFHLDTAWRMALGVFVVTRAAFTLWSLAVLVIVPTVVQNLDLFGAPVVTSFDLPSSQAFVLSRVVDDAALTFRSAGATRVTDAQTNSEWDLMTQRAVNGTYAGSALETAAYGVEDVFPYLGVTPATIPLLAVWQRFDTNWFLKIAARGYAGDDGSNVYMPLYPLLIRTVGTAMFGNNLLAALLVSNAALIAALVLLYRYTETVFSAEAAKRALVYLAVFPTAFFFLGGYTESLFLALALASLSAASKNHFVWAGIWGALAALTRLQGVLLLLPLLYTVWDQVAARKFEFSRRNLTVLLPLALIPLATAGFLSYTNLSLLSSYEGELHARFVLPWENLWASVSLLVSGGASSADLANLVATILCGAMCIAVWRRMPRALALYMLVMFLAPLFRMTTTQPLVSMTRYALALFPMFMLWGVWGKNGWVNRALIYPSFLLSMYFSAQFWMWGWVA